MAFQTAFLRDPRIEAVVLCMAKAASQSLHVPAHLPNEDHVPFPSAPVHPVRPLQTKACKNVQGPQSPHSP